MQQLQIPRNVQRFPRLDTVLMVEKFIQKHDGEYTRTELWSRLPCRMMYQTYRVIIHYLAYSRKISIDAEGKLGWIFYPGNKIQDNLFWRKDAAAV